jgi:8-oxo-dGTP diphosphatase
MKARAAVILFEKDRIALIERYRSGRHYFVFPGGKIEAGETPSMAARRETLEELGLEVEIGRLVAEVWYLGTPQYYFIAHITGGEFGTGVGKEMSSSVESVKGSHHPLWVPIDDLPTIPLLPVSMSGYVINGHLRGWPSEPLVLKDDPPHDAVQTSKP